MLVFQFILSLYPRPLLLVTPSAERISVLAADSHRKHIRVMVHRCATLDDKFLCHNVVTALHYINPTDLKLRKKPRVLMGTVELNSDIIR
jgi:hypothetical protein